MAQQNAINQYSEVLNVGPDSGATATTAIPLYVRTDANAVTEALFVNNDTGTAASSYVGVLSGGSDGAKDTRGWLAAFNTDFTTISTLAGRVGVGCYVNQGNGPGWYLGSNTQTIKHYTTSTLLYDMLGTGERTLPLQSAFLAFNSVTDSNVTGDNTAYTIINNSEVYDQNADYNNTTGTFTAPVTGRYLLVSAVTTEQLLVGHTQAVSYIVTSNRNYQAYYNPYNMMNSSSTRCTFIQSAVADMDASDTATTQVQVAGSTKTVEVFGNASTSITYFSGTLLC